MAQPVHLTPGTRTSRHQNPTILALAFELLGGCVAEETTTPKSRAIAIDSTFALAHAKVAVARIMIPRDKFKAERAIAAALALDPALSDAYDAVAEEQRAVLQNPGVAHYQSGLAEVFLYCRRYDEAIREFEENLDLVRDSLGTYRQIADAYFYQRKYDEALATYRKSGWPVPAWAYVPFGRLEEARKAIVTSEAEWARGGAVSLVAWNLARSYASLGERAQALTWLERTHDAGGGILVYLKVHPHFDSLRGEVRFQKLLQKVGLTN